MGYTSTWRWPISWSLVLSFLLYRNHASIPMLSAARVLTSTPLSALTANCEFTKAVLASLFDWWPKRYVSVMVSLSPLKAHQGFKWMLKVPSLKWTPLSAIWVTCAPLGTLTVQLLPDAVLPRESSGNYCLFWPPKVRCKVNTACVHFAIVASEDQTPLT